VASELDPDARRTVRVLMTAELTQIPMSLPPSQAPKKRTIMARAAAGESAGQDDWRHRRARLPGTQAAKPGRAAARRVAAVRASVGRAVRVSRAVQARWVYLWLQAGQRVAAVRASVGRAVRVSQADQACRAARRVAAVRPSVGRAVRVSRAVRRCRADQAYWAVRSGAVHSASVPVGLWLRAARRVAAVRASVGRAVRGFRAYP
jgi:hypothetical protein